MNFIIIKRERNLKMKEFAETTKLFIEIFGYASFIILFIVLSAAIYFVLKDRRIGKADFFLSKKRSIYRVQRPLAYWALFFILAIFNVFMICELACLPIDFAKGIGKLAFVVLVCVVIISCVKLKKNNSFIPILTCVAGDYLYLLP